MGASDQRVRLPTVLVLTSGGALRRVTAADFLSRNATSDSSDVLGHIFTFLDVDDCLSCAAVCRLWDHVLSRSGRWRKG